MSQPKTSSNKSIVKWIIISLSIVALLLCIPVVMLFLIDVNDYKNQISDLITEKTGRQFQIKGTISKSIYPWLGINLNDTRLSNPSGFAESDFVQIGELSIQVKLWPLLQGQAKIDTLHLNDLRLHLIQNKDGSNNWDFTTMKPATATAPPGSGKAMTPRSTDGQADGAGPGQKIQAQVNTDPLAGIDLAGLDIRKANIVWEDRKTGAYYQVDNLDLALSQFEAGKPVTLSITSDFTLKEPQLNGKIDLKTILNINLGEQRYQANIKRFKLDTTGDILPKSPMSVQLTADASFDGQSGLASVQALNLTSDKIQIQADLQQTKASPPAFQGRLRIPNTNLRQQLSQLKLPLPADLPDQALQQFSLQSSFKGDLQQLSLSDIKIQLDNTHISGKLNKLRYTPLALDWDLDIDQLDLDHYLPTKPVQKAAQAGQAPTKPAAETATTGAATTKADADPELLPLTMLRELDLNGETRIGQFNGLDLQLNDIKLAINANQGVLRAQPFEVSLYDGKVAGSIGLNAKTDRPKLRVIQRIKDLNASKLLKSAAQLDLVTAANVNANIDIDTVGNRISDWKKHLHGQVQFRLKDGAINGVNLLSGLIEKYEKYLKKTFPREEVENRTVFSELAGTLNIDKGIIKNDDLKAVAPELKVKGSGTANLIKENLDFRILLTALKLPPWLPDSAEKSMRDVEFPVHIEGPFTAPEFDYDISGPLKDKAKRSLKNKISEKKAELKQKLNEQQTEALDKQEAELRLKAEREKARAKEKLKKKQEELKEKFKKFF